MIRFSLSNPLGLRKLVNLRLREAFKPDGGWCSLRLMSWGKFFRLKYFLNLSDFAGRRSRSESFTFKGDRTIRKENPQLQCQGRASRFSQLQGRSESHCDSFTSFVRLFLPDVYTIEIFLFLASSQSPLKNVLQSPRRRSVIHQVECRAIPFRSLIMSYFLKNCW